MIRLEQATKGYKTAAGRKMVLDRADMTLPDGRSVGILGANGSGKSTLVRMLSGVEHLDSGSIRRTGTVSFPLGFGGTLHPLLSGRENVKFLARLHGADHRVASEWVERFAELGDYYLEPVGNYSSGMVARLAFGACLAIDFDTYLIDEVTAVGDARFRRRCLEAFEERMDRSDVVMVSHDEPTLRAWCDTGAILSGGRLTTYATIDEAIDAHAAAMRSVDTNGRPT